MSEAVERGEGVSKNIIYLPTNVWILLISKATWIQSLICACIGGYDLLRRCFNHTRLFGNIYLLSVCVTMFILGVPIGRWLRQGEIKETPRLIAVWMLYTVALTISVVLTVLVEIVDVTEPWLSTFALILGLYVGVNSFSLFVVYLRWREIRTHKEAKEDF